jgi:nicotinamidase-related amidase
MERILIVVDMLNDFCHKDGALATSPITNRVYAEDIIPAVETVVKDARAKGDPIIWLCDAHEENDKEFERFPKHAVEGTWGGQIINVLEPAKIEKSPIEMLIKKKRYSGFYGTELDFKIAQLQPEDTIVCGVCTSICVMDTVGGLANRDYFVTVPRALVADFDPEAHEAALNRMENLYGAYIL